MRVSTGSASSGVRDVLWITGYQGLVDIGKNRAYSSWDTTNWLVSALFFFRCIFCMYINWDYYTSFPLQFRLSLWMGVEGWESTVHQYLVVVPA
ncbi:hypothetical protein BO99DRAFT_17661 [Aspergillus violaceofuscus CBS 115571]|uniref:Uncharacterized protein n=1 Tax=Aspergillus violaceofuscus (strain CBS 115571) TaxID=1450538 RepID=A0A2V5HCY5_ASPV1|nr:hypothetical protein BO99DRAFT_17661 [Aspergillus violaceofuscus CBS 115571]